jgi:hypothetical protein
MENNNSNKKIKNEIEEMNQIWDKFVEQIDNYDKVQQIDYEEYIKKVEMMRHFNNRILRCNEICITRPDIKYLLYEEDTCLTSCQRKILEVEGVVKKYLNGLNLKNSLNPYK